MSHRDKFLINGVEVPSVTEVLSVIRKPFLENWRGRLGNKECDRIVQESIELGHRFHEAVESYFRGEDIPELPQREAQMFALFRGWALESKFTPVELEVHLKSETYGYHGTADVFGTFEGSPAILAGDWKTSSSISSDYGLQLSAYAQAFKEETGHEVTEGFIVRVDKKPGAKRPIEVERFTDLPRYFKTFLAVKDVWEFENKRGVWSNATRAQ